jgi:EmrB/QacA subfamily drug resistance transporter
LNNSLSAAREPAPLKSVEKLSFYPWLVVCIPCIGAFIGQVDASIVQLTLPALEEYFHATLPTVSWVATAYLLAYAATLPIFARMSEMFGRKLLYIAGYALFTAASLLCGLALDVRLLIAFRLLQGVGGGLLGANSLTILAKAAGPHRRGRAMGLFATAQAVGVSVGPVVGGLLLSTLGWRWVFWVSIPFGLAGIILGWLVLPQTAESDSNKRFDLWGAVLLTPALASVVILLSEFQTWKPGSTALIALLSAILLACFAWRELRQTSPLIDLHLFGVPAFLGGVIGVNLSYALLYAMFFLMSFAFMRGFGDSAISAGLHLAVVPISLGLVAPIGGKLYERFGPRLLTTAGMILCSAAIVILSLSLIRMQHDITGMAALSLFGIGLGIYIAPNNSATIAAAPAGRTGVAGGLVNLMRVLGCMGGIVTASTALSLRLHARTGAGNRTVGVPAPAIVGAVHEVLWTLLFFTIIAGGTSLFRPAPEDDQSSS